MMMAPTPSLAACRIVLLYSNGEQPVNQLVAYQGKALLPLPLDSHQRQFWPASSLSYNTGADDRALSGCLSPLLNRRFVVFLPGTSWASFLEQPVTDRS